MSEFLQAAGACAASAAEPATYEPVDVIRHLAHELRQPLSTIESIAFYLEMILPRAEGKARRQLGKLRQEVEEVNWILSDAIHFLGAVPLQFELTDLSEIVSRNVSEWIPVDGPKFEFHLSHGLPVVRLDIAQTNHMLKNVLSFFRRVSRVGDVIRVFSRAVAGRVVLEIQSTAPIYEEKELDTLFEPFNAHHPGASGLALASSRRIVEAHAGHIGFRSDPATGSPRLIISFPAAG